MRDAVTRAVEDAAQGVDPTAPAIAAVERFNHCSHEIQVAPFVAITGGVRAHWRCARCRVNGMLDFPLDVDLASAAGVEVAPSFVNALCEEILWARRIESNTRVQQIASRAIQRYVRSIEADRNARRGVARRIYVIRGTATGLLKIGISNDPDGRLRTLQTACAEPLELVVSFEGTETTEAELHERFADARHRGEWFAPTPGVLAWLQEIQP